MTETARGRVRVEPSAKRVRAFLGGHLVVDTTAPVLVWEKPYYPTCYLPVGDVRAQLVPTGMVVHLPSRGDAAVYDVVTAGGKAAGAAGRYLDSPLEPLRELARRSTGCRTAEARLVSTDPPVDTSAAVRVGQRRRSPRSPIRPHPSPRPARVRPRRARPGSPGPGRRSG
jgi:uncharacterized protein (DUF427 family)